MLSILLVISIVTARPLSPQEGARSRSPQLVYKFTGYGDRVRPKIIHSTGVCCRTLRVEFTPTILGVNLLFPVTNLPIPVANVPSGVANLLSPVANLLSPGANLMSQIANLPIPVVMLLHSPLLSPRLGIL